MLDPAVPRGRRKAVHPIFEVECRMFDVSTKRKTILATDAKEI